MIAKDKLRKITSLKKGQTKKKVVKWTYHSFRFAFMYHRPALYHVLNEKTGIC